MLSSADQTLAVALVGDIATTANPGGALAAVVATIAGHYSFDAMYPGFGLELLYVERDLIKVAMGAVWQQVQFKEADQQFNLQNKHQALAVRLGSIETEIATRLDQARASGHGVSVGVITKTAPIGPPLPVPFPDANDPRYAGSPYARAWKPE